MPNAVSRSPTCLADIPLFSDLPADALAAIEEGVIIRNFPKGAIVVTEGDESKAMYVVLSGRLKVYRTQEDGKETVLSVLSAGDFFGELALLAPAPRFASVMVQQPARLAMLTSDHVNQCLDRQPKLARNLLVSMAIRFREKIAWMSDLASMDVYGRVARFLIAQAQQQGDEYITEAMTQEEIAQHVGASREMINRILKELKVGGYITTRGRNIVIHKRFPERW